MLAGLKLKALQELVKDASREELVWISGYMAALTAQPLTEEKPANEFVQDAAFMMPACTVVYGTETGNSKKIATDFGNKLKKRGIQTKVKSLDQYRFNDLSKESHMIVVMSTQGDGEPPVAAKKFFDYIHENNQTLNQLKFGVLALGDSAYPLFCKAGEDVDKRLHQLGGRRIVPLKKCDTDFEADAELWIEELISAALAAGTPGSTATAAKPPTTKSGKKVYDATVVATVNMNDRGSNKETYHIEIATEEPIVYSPGDSLGVVAKNNTSSVKKILDLLSLRGHEELHFREQTYKAEELFTSKINVQYLPERIIQQYAALSAKEIPGMRMDLADLLRIYPPDKKWNAQQLVNILEPIAPRFYSIASSPASHGDSEVHVTVSRDRFIVDGQQRFGLCSDYLSCLQENDTLQVYIQKNNAFRLPDANTDIIMIGPGTGIAPFRSFLFERDAQGGSGRNWLFFGDQHFVTDFLYQTDLQSLRDAGVLTKLSVAFSRDQKEKVYVQHKMQQHAAELFNWINSGAQLYICGCKDPMSYDVEATLINIIAQQNECSKEEAEAYLSAMKEAGRYHKDVY